MARQWNGVVNAGSVFFTVFLFCRLYHWWWDWMPKYLFFAVIGALGIGLVAAFKRVRGDLEECRRGGPKEEVVHHALVHERQPRQDLRHREDDMHVPDGQEFLLPRRDPVVAGRGEALGTMPIPAAVVGEGRLRALITAIAMPAQRRRAALDERPEDASMLAREPGPLRLEKPIAESAHDRLDGGFRHRGVDAAPDGHAAAQGRCEGWASSGEAARCRLYLHLQGLFDVLRPAIPVRHHRRPQVRLSHR